MSEGRAAERATNLAEKVGLLAEFWQPRVIAELNDYQFKVVRLLGDFVWHEHSDTDEAFLFWRARCALIFRAARSRSPPESSTWYRGD